MIVGGLHHEWSGERETRGGTVASGSASWRCSFIFLLEVERRHYAGGQSEYDTMELGAKVEENEELPELEVTEDFI